MIDIIAQAAVRNQPIIKVRSSATFSFMFSVQVLVISSSGWLPYRYQCTLSIVSF